LAVCVLAFQALTALPCGQKALADEIYGQLSQTGVLMKYPKEELFPAFHPKSVVSEDDLTNNMAEVINSMLIPARLQKDLLKSLMVTEDILHRRCTKLREIICKEKHRSSGVHGSATFGEGAVVPYVRGVVVDLQTKARKLGDPSFHESLDEGDQVWQVPSETGGGLLRAGGRPSGGPLGGTVYLWDVRLSASLDRQRHREMCDAAAFDKNALPRSTHGCRHAPITHALMHSACIVTGAAAACLTYHLWAASTG
jgi:hypothetical protein